MMASRATSDSTTLEGALGRRGQLDDVPVLAQQAQQQAAQPRVVLDDEQVHG